MVTHALDLASLLLGSAVGAFVGLVIAVLVHAIARGALAKSAIASALLGRTRSASYGSFLTWGGWIGLQVTLSNIDLMDWSNGTTCRSCPTCCSSPRSRA